VEIQEANMITLETGVAITIISYLVFVTSYVVSLRKDLNNLQNSLIKFEDNLSSIKDLREDFVRLETKIEIFFGLSKGD
jgi:hypothetical protein